MTYAQLFNGTDRVLFVIFVLTLIGLAFRAVLLFDARDGRSLGITYLRQATLILFIVSAYGMLSAIRGPGTETPIDWVAIGTFLLYMLGPALLSVGLIGFIGSFARSQTVEELHSTESSARVPRPPGGGQSSPRRSGNT
ncbi:MAG: hypothetical protein ACRDQ0_08770 [Pseudonocardia sp.]